MGKRHIKVKSVDLVDTVLLLMMYLQLVILEFFGLGRTLNKVITVFILLRILLMKGSQVKSIIRVAYALIILFIVSFIFGENRNMDIGSSNFLMLVYPFAYVYYVLFLCKNRPHYIDSILKSAFWLFNATMAVNIYVMYQQSLNPFSFRAVVVGTEISYSADLISGLFAYASVHTFCLFSIFIILFNLSYRRTLKRTLQRVLIIWNILLTVVIMAISLANENKAGFILLPFCVLLYWFSGSERKTNRQNRVVIALCMGPILAFAFYSFMPQFASFIDNNVLRLLTMVRTAVTIGTAASGSNERISIIAYAFSHISTWLTGLGFGTSTFYQSGFQGFRHFGQSDLGSILILGGVWFIIGITYLYQIMFLRIVDAPRNKMIHIGVFLILFSTVVFTQCYTRVSIATCLVLIMLTFRMRIQQGEKVKNRND